MFLLTLYIIGIAAEGASGALAAGRHNMDWFGVIFIACATAIGGGSARDVLFGHYPLGWVAHPQFLLIVCACALITTRIPYFVARFEKAFLVLDALGLAVFSVIGAKIGLEFHAHLGVASATAMGVAGAVITGVFGGILRDIFCAQIPLVFQKELYASIALFVGLAFVGLRVGLLGFDTLGERIYNDNFLGSISKEFASFATSSMSENIIILICLIFGFVARLLAIRFKLGLPVFRFKDKQK